MKTVLITGLGRKGALGFETARLLGKDGYHVILFSRRREQLPSLVEDLQTDVRQLKVQNRLYGL